MRPFRKKPPDRPADPIDVSDSDSTFHGSLSKALLAVEIRRYDLARAHFNQAIESADDNHQRAQAFRDFGNALASAKANDKLSKTYLEIALTLAVDAKDEELANKVQHDLFLLDRS